MAEDDAERTSMIRASTQSEVDSESLSNKDENELATIRVRTMYNLVEELQVSAGATDALTRLLYLTNMQAQLFKAETVPKMLQAFEVKQASLVINLMESAFYPTFYPNYFQTPEQQENFYLHMTVNVFANQTSFSSTSEATAATRNLSSFFKDVLLPLAAETNAIVICSAKNTDILSATLTTVLPLFAAKFNGKLPFTVFAIAPACTSAWSTLHDESSIASELANKSKNWQKGLTKLEAATNKSRGTDAALWSSESVQPGLANYIFIEGVSGKGPGTWAHDTKPFNAFSSELLQALASQLPTLCIRTGGSGNSTPVSANVQLANRDIPVLMLDTQPRPSFGDVLSPLKTRAKEAGIDEQKIEEANTANDPERALIELIINEMGVRSDSDTTDMKLQTLRAELESMVRDELIDKAIAANKARHEELWALGKVQQFDQHDLAYFFDVLNDDGDANTTVAIGRDSSGGMYSQSLFKSIKHSEKVGGEDSLPFTQEQLVRVIDHMVEMTAQSFFMVLPAAKREELQQQENFDPMSHYSETLEAIWSTYYDVFKSQRIYGANLANMGEVQALIDQIVKRDRLPSRNSLEAQLLLRDAWNTIDVCAHTATKYKFFAKTSYIFCLLLSLVVIALTVFRESTNESEVIDPTPTCGNRGVESCLPSDDNITLTCSVICSLPGEADTTETILDASAGIFITTALLTVVTGVTSFSSPSQRWRELRAVVESLQSDVFMFRSRTGIYTIDRSKPRKPEECFIQRIQEARLDVVQVAGLTESSFVKKYTDKVYCHGQNATSTRDTFEIRKLSEDSPADMEQGVDDKGRVIDNHHSPMCVASFLFTVLRSS
jgi:hypothetical protein